MTMTAIRTYTRLFSPKTRGDGHSIFREVETGNLVFGDSSAQSPEKCENGPLYPVIEAEMVLGLSSSRSVCVEVRLVDDAGKACSTWTSVDTARALQAQVGYEKNKLIPVIVKDPAIIGVLEAMRDLGVVNPATGPKLGRGDYEWEGHILRYDPKVSEDVIADEGVEVPAEVEACIRFAHGHRMAGPFLAGDVKLFCHG
ncbi:hypothetical protein ABIC83_002977 [Roseateles asaccharophilus]|uniref:hypothetical protein n=1 Tax=Roseateles asaccharophilus TaxID=582607 RepID=UPI0038381360